VCFDFAISVPFTGKEDELVLPLVSCDAKNRWKNLEKQGRQFFSLFTLLDYGTLNFKLNRDKAFGDSNLCKFLGNYIPVKVYTSAIHRQKRALKYGQVSTEKLHTMREVYMCVEQIRTVSQSIQLNTTRIDCYLRFEFSFTLTPPRANIAVFYRKMFAELCTLFSFETLSERLGAERDFHSSLCFLPVQTWHRALDHCCKQHIAKDSGLFTAQGKKAVLCNSEVTVRAKHQVFFLQSALGITSRKISSAMHSERMLTLWQSPVTREFAEVITLRLRVYTYSAETQEELELAKLIWSSARWRMAPKTPRWAVLHTTGGMYRGQSEDPCQVLRAVIEDFNEWPGRCNGRDETLAKLAKLIMLCGNKVVKCHKPNICWLNN